MPLALVSALHHYIVDFAEDRLDAPGYTRHNGASGNGYEASHEGIFDKILTTGVTEDPEFPSEPV